MPLALAIGISIAKTGRYRLQLWISRALTIISAGVFSILKVDTNFGFIFVAEILGSSAQGVLQAGPQFPILAPTDEALNANPSAFFMYLRFLAQESGYLHKVILLLTLCVGMGYLNWRHGNPGRFAEENSR